MVDDHLLEIIVQAMKDCPGPWYAVYDPEGRSFSKSSRTWALLPNRTQEGSIQAQSEDFSGGKNEYNGGFMNRTLQLSYIKAWPLPATRPCGGCKNRIRIDNEDYLCEECRK